jgi:diguanylate cyclase
MGDRATAEAWASAANESIRAANLAPTPEAFAVYFEYHAGRKPALRRVMDVLTSNGQPLDATTLQDLHARFISPAYESFAVREAAGKLQTTLSQVLESIKDGKGDANRFGTAVRSAAGSFSAGRAPLADLIQTLLSEAKEMAARTSRLEEQLGKNSDELADLQKTLEEARKEANTDALTGLANRRHFDTLLRTRAGHAMNDDTDLSLLLVDIDHFKRVNDTFGHPIGDSVLRFVAQHMQQCLRETDVAARYGGEEFGVLLAANLDRASAIGVRICETFARQPIVIRETGQSIGVVTISIGAAEYEKGEPLGRWVERSDSALYQAKDQGRNRLVALRS